MSLLFRLIFLMPLLLGVSSLTMAYEEQAPCSVQQNQEARAKFKGLYDQKRYAEAEVYLSGYIDQCSDGMYRSIEPVSLYYWMVSDLMSAQEKTGHFNKCIARGLGMLNRWWWGDEVDREREGKAASAVEFNIEKCRSRLPELQGVRFSSEKCPLNGYENALAIPQSWNTSTSNSNDLCVYHYPGKRLDEDEFLALEEADINKSPPTLVIVKRDGRGGYSEQKLPFIQGNLSDGEGCGPLKVRLGAAHGKKLVLLSGTLGFCWPGNATWAVDAVYNIEPSKAVLVNEVVVYIH